MSLLSVDDALARCLDDVRPTETEMIELAAADGRVLAHDLAALRTQPPFDGSAMDGYAVRLADAVAGAEFSVVGQSAAGHAYPGIVGPHEAVRIFTGAPMPQGADAIVIQENATRDGPTLRITDGAADPKHIRRQGIDFQEGDTLIPAGAILGPRALTLAAAMGHATLPVHRRPHVALVATGDELVLPGEQPDADQIVCSNPFGIAAMLQRAGAQTTFTGIARDTEASLQEHLERTSEADLVITIGGASVGDHDLVAPALKARGVMLDFWKIAMRPGKPLMYGRRGRKHYLGLPGNPVSSLVCARVFAVPLVKALLGIAWTQDDYQTAILTEGVERNGPRRHYMRAISGRNASGQLTAALVASQDSSLLATLYRADALIVREADAPAAERGESVALLSLDF